MGTKLNTCKLGCRTAVATDEVTLPPLEPWKQPRKRQQARLCPECRMAFQCCKGRGMCCKCRAQHP
jgi:hypothetical protein